LRAGLAGGVRVGDMDVKRFARLQEFVVEALADNAVAAE
jgi:hypothetical protein